MLPDQVIITDVAPRDGLQNEPEILPVDARIVLVELLLAAGVPRVEVGSFVNPKQVPQMAGAGEVVRELLKHQEAATGSRAPGAENRAGDEPGETQVPGARLAVLTALVPNMRGYELAVEAGLRHVRLVLAASEALNQANFRRPVAESLAEFAAIAARAQAGHRLDRWSLRPGRRRGLRGGDRGGVRLPVRGPRTAGARPGDRPRARRPRRG